MLLPMKTIKTSFFVVVGLVLLGVAALVEAQQSVPASVATGFSDIREETLRADLTFLASDALEGRMSLQTGDEVAIQWIASEFAKAGLKPAANGSFLQPVELIEYRGDRSQSFVALKRGGSEKQWKFPDALGSYRADVDVTADVIFAGYGITAPELHYDDYQGIDAKDKIVLVLRHQPQEMDPKSAFNSTPHASFVNKAINAKQHGARGIVFITGLNHPEEEVGRATKGIDTDNLGIPAIHAK